MDALSKVKKTPRGFPDRLRQAFRFDTAAQMAVWSLFLTLYYPIVSLLYRKRWNAIDYTHAYFILPIALGLAWLLRARLKEAFEERPSRGHAIGYGLLLAASLALAVFAGRRQYVFLVVFSMLPALAGLCGWLYGGKVVRVLLFPILYLLFMVPPPLGVLDSLTLPMRYGVSIVTERILSAFGLPLTREGLLLYVGGREVYLGEACSGFRSLVTLLALGLVYIYRLEAGRTKKIAMAAAIVPLSLTGNLLRVLSVVLVTYAAGPGSFQRFFHDASGFIVFLVMIGGLLFLEKRLR